MALKPFLKWAGGKRWLLERTEFKVPAFTGTYIEPFLGGGSVFFHLLPPQSLLSDLNPHLIETYQALSEEWKSVWLLLIDHHNRHSRTHYYNERGRVYSSRAERAAQFIYLNRACWNGLYRENLQGKFNVPIGSKSKIVYEYDDFESTSSALSSAKLVQCDFEETIDAAGVGDFVFVDPPYTTAHNLNGFVKYNQRIFNWSDQVRLKDALVRAADRGSVIMLTNAGHSSISELYDGVGEIADLHRASVISGKLDGRKSTSEKVILLGFDRVSSGA